MKNKNIKYYIFVWSKDKKKKLTDRKEQKMELVNGRPKIEDGRFDKEIRVYDFLDKIGVDYQRVDHVAAMKMEECEEVDKTLGDGTAICKNLFLCNRQETDFYLLLIPGDKNFKTKYLSSQIGSSVCVTDPGFRERFSVSPIESTNACPKLRIPHGFVRNADERI